MVLVIMVMGVVLYMGYMGWRYMNKLIERLERDKEDIDSSRRGMENEVRMRELEDMERLIREEEMRRYVQNSQKNRREPLAPYVGGGEEERLRLKRDDILIPEGLSSEEREILRQFYG